jgi:hypothetical protein
MIHSQLKAALPYIFAAKQVPLIYGAHGIGKSSAVRQYAQENGLELIDVRLGLMEPGDLLGLPDLSKGKTKFAPPNWLPTEGKGILFLDEINRARRDVLQAIFQLVLDRRIHDYSLPEPVWDKDGKLVSGWFVVAAANPATGDYVVNDLGDKALLARFVQIKLDPSVAEFASYVKAKRPKAGVVADFFTENPGMLTTGTEDFAIYSKIKPSGRTSEALMALMEVGTPEELLRELAMGLIGAEAANAFLSYLATQERLLTGQDIVDGYLPINKGKNKSRGFQDAVQKAVAKQRMDYLAESGKNLYQFLQNEDGKGHTAKDLDDKQAANVKAFLMDLPADLFYSVFEQCMFSDKLTTQNDGKDKGLCDDDDVAGRWERLIEESTAKGKASAKAA